jgi:hypothetical protein
LGSDGGITIVECLFKKEGNYGPVFYFRDFDFYKNTKNVDDGLKQTSNYGIGFADHDLNKFIQLREFYLEHSNTPVEIAQ